MAVHCTLSFLNFHHCKIGIVVFAILSINAIIYFVIDSELYIVLYTIHEIRNYFRITTLIDFEISENLKLITGNENVMNINVPHILNFKTNRTFLYPCLRRETIGF